MENIHTNIRGVNGYVFTLLWGHGCKKHNFSKFLTFFLFHNKNKCYWQNKYTMWCIEITSHNLLHLRVFPTISLASTKQWRQKMDEFEVLQCSLFFLVIFLTSFFPWILLNQWQPNKFQHGSLWQSTSNITFHIYTWPFYS